MLAFCMVHCTKLCLCLNDHCWALVVQCWSWCSELRRLIVNIGSCVVNVGRHSWASCGELCRTLGRCIVNVGFFFRSLVLVIGQYWALCGQCWCRCMMSV